MNKSRESPSERVVLLGLAEIAELLNASRQAVSNWRTRDEGFPKPTADLKSGPVWLEAEIKEWAHANGLRVRSSERTVEGAATKKAVVCAVTNAKGGVGKSTVTLNLAWFCYLRLQKRVLLVDLDPQFNLSQYALGGDAYEKLIQKGGSTISDVFGGPSTSENSSPSFSEAIHRVRSRSSAYLDLLPSNLELAWIVRDGYGKTDLLDNFLTHKVGKDKYDLILIDCPPTDSTLTDAAFAASDWLLIPVRPEFLPAIGLPLIDRSLRKFFQIKPSSGVKVAGVVLNAVSKNKVEYQRSKAEITQAAKQFHWPVFDSEIGASDSYPKGARMGLPVMMTNHARWDRIKEFTAFGTEFAKRIGL